MKMCKKHQTFETIG